VAGEESDQVAAVREAPGERQRRQPLVGPARQLGGERVVGDQVGPRGRRAAGAGVRDGRFGDVGLGERLVSRFGRVLGTVGSD